MRSMPDYLHAPGIAMPTPAHTLTPAAEHARQAVRSFAARRNAERTAPPELVTEHVPPWLKVDPASRTGGAKTLINAALAAGHKVEVFAAGLAVEVRVDGGRIRAWWKPDGTTGGALVAGHKANVTQAKAAL